MSGQELEHALEGRFRAGTTASWVSQLQAAGIGAELRSVGR
jgi:hypothetical protein